MSTSLLVWVTLASAQELKLPALSPHASVSQAVGVIEVSVDYSSPAVKGRTVWGDLVPYDAVWRTGANAATRLTTSGDVTIGGAAVPAGTYSLFTIPGQSEWTLIVNRDPEASTEDYDQAKDVVRVPVKPEQAPARERMTFLFSDTQDASTRLDLEWAGLRVSVPIAVDTDGLVKANLDGYASDAANGLARAARYKSEHGDVEGALKLLDASIAVEETWYNTWLKAEALHKKEANKDAYKLAQRAQELGAKEGDDFFWKDRVEKALAEWKKK